MTFDITLYTNSLCNSLDRLTNTGKISFSAWCTDYLFHGVASYIIHKTSADHYAIIHESLEYLWICAMGETPSVARIDHLEKACDNVTWQEEDVADDEQTLNFYALDAFSALTYSFDTCRSNSSTSAAKTAVAVINTLDWTINAELGYDTTELIFSTPKMQSELERQQMMVEYLRTSSGLKADQHRLFR